MHETGRVIGGCRERLLEKQPPEMCVIQIKSRRPKPLALCCIKFTWKNKSSSQNPEPLHCTSSNSSWIATELGGCSQSHPVFLPKLVTNLPNGTIMMKNSPCETWVLSLQREFKLGLFSRVQPGVFPVTDVLALCLAKKHTVEEQQALSYYY